MTVSKLDFKVKSGSAPFGSTLLAINAARAKTQDPRVYVQTTEGVRETTALYWTSRLVVTSPLALFEKKAVAAPCVPPPEDETVVRPSIGIQNAAPPPTVDFAAPKQRLFESEEDEQKSLYELLPVPGWYSIHHVGTGEELSLFFNDLQYARDAVDWVLNIAGHVITPERLVAATGYSVKGHAIDGSERLDEVLASECPVMHFSRALYEAAIEHL